MSDFDIAIIGMAGRFPGAADLEQFWRNLAQGVESITFFSDEAMRAAGVAPELLSQPTYVKANAVVDSADSFDAHFFNISPREASLMDPQQRLFLECAWSALEHAGYDTAQVAARIGVFAGAQMSTYLLYTLYPHLATLSEAEQFQAQIGNDKDYLATQTAYRLNLRGPALSVQTACSTSLVAVHLACQSLLNRECDLALAGGVALRLPQVAGYRYEAGGILSPDGHCRPFAAQANGTVSGDGVGVVALKRLGDALADGDAICAVIKGSAINNDGAGRLGFTAPSEEGQATVISEALAMAGVEAADISYVEAHGTGTPLGDPIEIAALTRAFEGCPPHSCAIGSVKGNIGHLDAAAGIAGLIKAVLSLQHQALPPSLHAGDPNPKIPWAHTPFYVNTRLRPWPAGDQPRRAGVSSFGIGGTNAHVVLEAPPLPSPATLTGAPQILPLSAQTPEGLATIAQRLADHLERSDAPSLADVAYTCQRGRRAWPYRRVVVGRDVAEVIATLRAPDGLAGHCEPGFRPIAFLFPGQGAQYASMGRQLFSQTPLLRDILEQCAQQLKPWLGLDLREVLYLSIGSAADERLNSTALAQPALFVIEYALAQLWRAWGLTPQAMLGHSLGEYVAACLAGVFSLEEALWLVTQRGRLMQSLPPGAMLAVQLSEAVAARFIHAPLALAANNAPESISVAGPMAAIEELAARLSAEGIGWRRLATSHAFHSPMMEPIMEAFAQVVQGVALRPPIIPFIANVTGNWITPAQATDPGYWAEQLRRPVQFARGVATLAAESGLIGLEVGPGHTLRTLIRQHQPSINVVTSLPPARAEAPSDALFLRQSLGQLWLAGATPDWEQVHAPDRPRRIPLPTYPFQRQRYWPAFSETQALKVLKASRVSATQEMGRRAESDWFYLPYWKPTAWPAAGAVVGSVWLVGAESPLAVAWQQHTPGAVWLDSAESPLPVAAPPPTHLIYLADEQFNAPHLAHLLQRLQRAQCLPAQLTLVTHGAQVVSPQEKLTSHQAQVVGMGLVIPQEYPGLVCRQIDLPSAWPSRESPRLAAQLAAELGHTDQELMVAWRQGQRWTLQFEPATPPPLGITLRPGGVYLIIGGWGQAGRALARSLAEELQAKIALLGRRRPTESERAWQRSLESAGAETLALTADVADEVALRQALAQVEARFGALNGVFHAAGADAAHLFVPLSEMGSETWEAHFRPKVAGVDALAHALAERNLDFCLLFSSLAAQLGGLGFAAYAAANRYLDVMAHHCRQTQATPWVSVNWDALKFDADEAEQAFGARLRQTALTPAELTRACQHILRLGPPPQVVVSTTDLAARRRQWLGNNAASPSQAGLALSTQADGANQAASLVARHSRPLLATPYAPPQTALERSLATMWGEVLNIDPIGRHDNLFDLGGHSLFATQIAARVRTQLAVELPLADLFTSVTTVAEMAQVIEQRQLAQAEADALAAALEDLEKLSDEEIAALLAQAGDDGVEV